MIAISRSLERISVALLRVRAGHPGGTESVNPARRFANVRQPGGGFGWRVAAFGRGVGRTRQLVLLVAPGRGERCARHGEKQRDRTHGGEVTRASRGALRAL